MVRLIVAPIAAGRPLHGLTEMGAVAGPKSLRQRGLTDERRHRQPAPTMPSGAMNGAGRASFGVSVRARVGD